MDLTNADIRLMAFDLDGTLLNSAKELTPRNKSALERAAEKGIQIVPTTGRLFQAIPEEIRAFPFLRYAITINGAAVFDTLTGDNLYRAEIPLENAIGIMSYLDQFPVIYDCYKDNGGLMTRSMWDQAEVFAPNAYYVRSIRTMRKPVPELKEFLLQQGGSVQKIQEAGELIKAYNSDIYFHVDAVQGYGKFVIRPKSMKIDLLSVSGHKIHGPKGIGFLYIKKGTKINPICYGGGQQKGMRSGTENVPGIAGLALAAKMCYENFEDKQNKLYELKEYLIKSLNERLSDIKVNGPACREGAPHIVSVSIKGLAAETVLNMLSSKNIYVSAGSACTSNNPHISDTLQAIGLEKDLLESTIRISMSFMTTKEEIDYFLDTLCSQVENMRKFYRH